MKIPEKAPDWHRYIKNIFEFSDIDKLNELVVAVEQRDEYAYWDKVKHLPMPENISPELAWAYLKFSRQSKIRRTPLVGEEGQHFGYWIPDNAFRNISYLDQHAGGEILIGDKTIHRSEQKRYLVNSLMEEAIASSLLEGAATTRKEAKEMLRSGRKPRDHAEQMIFNNYKTIVKIKDLVKSPLSNDLILELHRSMTVDTLDDPGESGRFRAVKDEAIAVRDAEGQTLYVPPSPEKIPKMMAVLYDYANTTEETQFTHPIIKAINLHFYLSYIHPFMDGNGRTARALFYWYMLKHGYWMFEYLTISRIFLISRAQYAKAFLYTEIDDLDLTYFISFHLKVVNNAVRNLIEYIRKKQKEAQEAARYLLQYPDLNDRQKALLRNALENPDRLYTIACHGSVHSVTYECARRDLLGLAKKGFLIITKKGREFIFVPSGKSMQKFPKAA